MASDDTPNDSADPGDGPTRRADSGDSASRRNDPGELPAKGADLGDFPTVRGLSAGRRLFGRYLLETELGAGGMGVVWRARDAELEEAVALKFLPEMVARDDTAVDELKDETRHARRLTHPNIVRIYQFERDGAIAAVSMEFVDGVTLAKLRLAQPNKVFSVRTLAPLVAQLCAALDYAHRQAKIVHRDLKPANILVTRDDVLKVTDFGIARSLSESSTRLTGKGGETGGTIPYMSPQQVRGRKPKETDDLYSLGAMLYELLTGKPPFFRGDPYSLRIQILENIPLPLAEQRAELGVEGEPIPSAWEETILACLAKEPEKRPQSAGEVAERLGLGETAKHAKWREEASATNRMGEVARVVPNAPVKPREFVVIVDPANVGARVWLGPASNVEVKDGRAVVEDVPDGEQELTVQAEGYQPFTTLVTVKEGRGRAEVRLIAVKGAIAIKARPGTVVTAVDARGNRTELGTVPAGGLLASNNLLTVGGYTLKLAHDDCAPVEMPGVELVIGRAIRVAASAQTPLTGELRVFSVPTGAEVRVNGEVAGSTPATIKNQPSEQVLNVEVLLLGYRRVEQMVTLKPKEIRSVNVGTMTAETGGIELRFANDDIRLGQAAISVDGKPFNVGSALAAGPVFIEDLEIGSHVVEITHPDWEPWLQEVTVRDQENTPVDVTLAIKPPAPVCEAAPSKAGVVVGSGNQHEATFIGSQKETENRTPVRGMLPPEIRGAEFQPALPGRTEGDRVLKDRAAGAGGRSTALHPALPRKAKDERSISARVVEMYPLPGTMRKSRFLLLAVIVILGFAAAGWWFFGSDIALTREIDAKVAKIAENVFSAAGKLGEVALPATQVRHDGPKEGQPWTVPDLNLEMMYIRPGTFTMGEGSDAHQVTLTKSFWLGMTEVTQGQWKALMGGNPSYFKDAGRDAPVEQVSWDDALEFCHRLTERERLAGGLPEGYEYSLPTEAQWEFACRAGTTGDYAGDLAATAWYLNNSGNTTHRVAQKQANLWGLYDMHGNVWEWCKDWYGDYPVGSATDPTGPSLGTLRVYRGGGLYSNARDCRSPNRYGLAPGFRGLRLGFRLALATQASSVSDAKPTLVPGAGTTAAPSSPSNIKADAASTVPVAESASSSKIIPHAPKEPPITDNRTANVPVSLGKIRGAQEGQAWTVPDLNLEMVYIRPGTFTMGSPATEQNRSNDETQHQVVLTKGFWLGKTVVTQGQWEALMGNNPSNFKNAGRDAPVEQVSWNDAMDFCHKLTEREQQAGRLSEGYEYTLPTEAQWEYACRAGTTGAYAGDLDSMAWYSQNSGNTTHPVGQKQANAWGLYDMHGNVWEWCRDWYGNYPGGSVTDPTGPSRGSFRVGRGGSWGSVAGFCRSADRDGFYPGFRGYGLGFRVALAPQVSR